MRWGRGAVQISIYHDSFSYIFLSNISFIINICNLFLFLIIIFITFNFITCNNIRFIYHIP
jgi:hypothetical protein